MTKTYEQKKAKLMVKAEECLTRKQAQKILKKAAKLDERHG